jgi:hypothetical protein
MIRNYLKRIVRGLIKSKTYFLLNSVALTAPE